VGGVGGGGGGGGGLGGVQKNCSDLETKTSQSISNRPLSRMLRCKYLVIKCGKEKKKKKQKTTTQTTISKIGEGGKKGHIALQRKKET